MSTASGSGQFSDLVDVFRKSVAAYDAANLFGTKRDDVWEWITYAEFGRRVDDLRGGLASIGIGAGDTVGIIAANRVEWAVAAYATYGLGARFCPMYENQLDKDRKYIVEDSGALVVLSSTYPIYETTREWVGEVGNLRHVYCMALPAEDEASFLRLEAIGRENPVPTAEIDPESVCGFIYTSGTTGKPKGVLLSHRNIVSNLNAVSHLFPIDSRDVSVSFLPWAHSFGQTCELHTLFSRGAGMAIAESVEKLVENFGEVRPTLLFAVPRVFNRIYDRLHKRFAEEGGIKKKLFDAAMANAEERKRLAARGESSTLAELKHKFFDAVVFSKVREYFGGRLRYAVSGGAALSPEVAEFIDNLGIMVCEGYGLTETSPITSCNRPGARRIGSVGLPIEGVKVIIDESAMEDGAAGGIGEIIVKGPNVMMGYHNLPEETSKVIGEDGSFRTGDLGRLDEDGFLYITGRVKEQYKLENGKYVAPAPLEEQLQLSGYVAQAFIDGANQPSNVALIVPDREAIGKWAKKNGVDGDYESLLRRAEVHDLIAAELRTHSKDFKGYEKIKRFELIPEEFTIENGMLTPKMSVKRNLVLERYASEIEALHQPAEKSLAAAAG